MLVVYLIITRIYPLSSSVRPCAPLGPLSPQVYYVLYLRRALCIVCPRALSIKLLAKLLIKLSTCRPRLVATTLCLIFSFYYLSIIKYRLYSYIIQLVLSSNYISVLASLLVLYHSIVYIIRLYSLLQQNRVLIPDLPT